MVPLLQTGLVAETFSSNLIGPVVSCLLTQVSELSLPSDDIQGLAARGMNQRRNLPIAQQAIHPGLCRVFSELVATRVVLKLWRVSNTHGPNRHGD